MTSSLLTHSELEPSKRTLTLFLQKPQSQKDVKFPGKQRQKSPWRTALLPGTALALLTAPRAPPHFSCLPIALQPASPDTRPAVIGAVTSRYHPSAKNSSLLGCKDGAPKPPETPPAAGEECMLLRISSHSNRVLTKIPSSPLGTAQVLQVLEQSQHCWVWFCSGIHS